MVSSKPIPQRPRGWSPGRLILARELRGLTRAELASAIGKSAAAVGQFEAGVIQPYARVARAIASVLSVPIDFMHRAPSDVALGPDGHFMRPTRGVTQVARRQSAARSAVLGDLYNRLTEQTTVPKSDIPRVRVSMGVASEFELIAEGLRAQWNLANNPIPDLIALLESHGVVVAHVDDRAAPTGTFATWHSERPWVLLATSAGTASQARLDAAHELGHLVIHARADLHSPEAERQADRFALAFLMPRREFERDIPKRVTGSALGILKRRWGVPLAEIVRRGYDLGLLSEASFRRSHARLNSASARLAEPDEPAAESPATLLAALANARETDTLDAVFEIMGMTKGFARELLGANAV